MFTPSKSAIVLTILIASVTYTGIILTTNEYLDTETEPEQEQDPESIPQWNASFLIIGDENFTKIATQNNWPGSGALNDPIIIERLALDHHNKTGMYMTNTSLHFIIRDSNLAGGHFGLIFNKVSNGLITENLFSKYQRSGISVHSSNLIIEDNLIIDNSNSAEGEELDRGSTAGIYLTGSIDQTKITSNHIINNEIGISIDTSTNITISENTISGNQIGIRTDGACTSHACANFDFRISFGFDVINNTISQNNRSIDRM
jgi:parallel beta-helix repeat protein